MQAMSTWLAASEGAADLPKLTELWARWVGSVAAEEKKQRLAVEAADGKTEPVRILQSSLFRAGAVPELRPRVAVSAPPPLEARESGACLLLMAGHVGELPGTARNSQPDPCTLHHDARLVQTLRAVETRLTGLRGANAALTPRLESSYPHIFGEYVIS